MIRDDKAQANVLIEELQALYCSGPAGGGGFRSSLTAQLATGSILVPRDEVTARVEVVEPPARLVWSWVHEAGVDFDDAPSTRVEWRLTARADGGTTLSLRESGFRTDVHFRQNTDGWVEELGELVAFLV